MAADVFVGIAIYCAQCGHQKKPRGRSQPIGSDYCNRDCPGWEQEPLVGDLWPGETNIDFGYPCSRLGTMAKVD